MTHRERAQAFYADEPWKLEHWELLFATHGVVINRPELYALGKPVNSKAPASLILTPEFRFRPVDCWLVWYTSGSMSAVLSLMPFPLPLACFERKANGKLQFYDIARLKRLAGVPL